jgi:Flp pilus assembly protein TadG
MKKKPLLPRSPRGQSLVELAISLVILLYLLSGAAEFAILFFQYVQMRDAAQEGALYGSINPPSSAGDTAKIDAIITRVKHSSSSPIDLVNDPGVTVSVVVTDAKYCEGGSLRVRVTYPHKVFMPFMSKIIGATRTLQAEVIDTILTPAPLPSGLCP